MNKMVKYGRNFSEEELDFRMTFINKIHLRTWIQLTCGHNGGVGECYISSKPEEERVADFGCLL